MPFDNRGGIRITTIHAIETNGLRKSFGKLEVLKGIDLQVRQGSVYALLGPNGAGKTTIVNILSTLMRADSGQARVFGHDVSREPDAVRNRIGLTGQFASVDEELSGRNNLYLFAKLLGYASRPARARAELLLEAFGLAEAGDRPSSQYSGGMKRRLDIAAAMLAMPDLLFLDEPTTGLDPRSRNEVWSIVRALVAQGTTVLLTTQYLDEADRLADRLAVIDEGTVIAEGTAAELKKSVGSGTVHVRLNDPARREEAARIVKAVLGETARLDDDPAALSATARSNALAGEALAALVRAGIETEQFSVGLPSLDDVFLSLTGKKTGNDKEASAS
ncbi:ATP-binding cassette domain-containing protein [Cohnella sp. GCM10027633]|uniref:ATP-binding cassette domain-containing protein n=1 Tax=unclassified Cohnella TaxID=2636738 RepID=UPI0036380F6A